MSLKECAAIAFAGGCLLLVAIGVMRYARARTDVYRKRTVVIIIAGIYLGVLSALYAVGLIPIRYGGLYVGAISFVVAMLLVYMNSRIRGPESGCNT